MPNTYPALHNAMWPGLVGKGPDSEPPIDLETMLCLPASANVDGQRFDGVDLFLSLPHTDIDSSDDDLARLADNLNAKKLRAGSLVAPVWPPTGGGSAMGDEANRSAFLTQVRKACRIGSKLRELGVRPYGVVRIDSASSVEEWSKDADANQRRIVETFSEACDVAESFGERLAAEGEICWGGVHSWKRMAELLGMVGRPKTVGFQADVAHPLLYPMGNSAPEDRILPEGPDWSSRSDLDAALKTVTNTLRPWTIDFHFPENEPPCNVSGAP